jgi:hypothetical protein
MASRDARLITKRTSVPGKIPTGTTLFEVNLIRSGELASNLADKKLFGYDGANVFEYGSNSFLGLTGGTVTGDVRVIGNLSASTFYSGSTDVETIIRNLISADTHTFVQPGSNIITGGTSQYPIVSTVDSPSFNDLAASGNTGLQATTATTINVENYIDFEGDGDPIAVSGRTYYDVSENALSYYPETPAMDVTINLGQESVIQIYNETGVQINNGEACHIVGSFGGVPTVKLASASAITVVTDTKFEVNGVATHDIPNGTYGFITKFGIVRDLTITGTTNDSDIWLSDVEPGALVYSLPATYASRITKVGHVIETGTTTGRIFIDIANPEVGALLSSKQIDVISQNNSSTGLREGGIITINGGDNTKFDVSAGTGVVVDNFTNPLEPVTTEVSWSTLTGNTVDSLTGESGTYVFMDEFGDVFQLPVSTIITGSDRRNYIYLGLLGHGNKINITNAFSTPNFITSPINQLNDFTYAVGPFSMSGNKISTVPGTLSLAKTSGVSYINGGNFKNDKSNPSVVSSISLSASTLIYATGQGVLGPSGTTVDTQNYDPSGLGVITPLSNPNDITAHRIWFEPINNSIVFQFGQYVYASVPDAKAGFDSEDYIVPSGLGEVPYLVAVLITEASADGSNLDGATLIPQGKFAGTGGGGGLSVTSLQSAYNNSTSPEIVTDSSRNSVDFRAGSGLDTNNLVTFQDDTGDTNAYITGQGNASFNNLSGATIYSGGTDLYDIFITTNDITRVQPGTNINTGGTANEPIINLDSDIVLTSVNATSVSATTFYSGSTNIEDIFLTSGDLSGTSVSAGSNVSVNNVGIDYEVSVVDSPSFNNLAFSGTATGGGLIIDGNTALSGLTTVYGDTPTSAAIQPGLDNTYDLGAPSFRWREIFTTNIDISNALSTEFLYVDNTSVFNGDVSITGNTTNIGDLFVSGNISGATLYSGSTDVETIIRSLITGEDTYATGATLSADTTLIISRNDGVDITTDLSIQRDISFNAEEFVIDSATKITLTPITISAIRFVGVGQPDVAGIGLTVPDDYKDGGNFSYIWRSSTTSTTLSAKTSYDMYTGNSTSLGSLVTSVESFSISDTPESTANVFIYSPSYTPTTVLSPGMKIHLTITRDPGDAGDTLGSNLDMTDFVFTYNALR